MKKIIISILIVFTLAGCVKTEIPTDKPSVEEEAKVLLEKNYKNLYGIDVDVNINNCQAAENNTTYCYYGFELDSEDSFYHHVSGVQFKTELDIVQRLKEDDARYQASVKGTELAKEYEEEIQSIVQDDMKHFFYITANGTQLDIQIAIENKHEFDYYEELANQMNKLFSDDYNLIIVHFIEVNDLDQLENSPQLSDICQHHYLGRGTSQFYSESKVIGIDNAITIRKNNEDKVLKIYKENYPTLYDSLFKDTEFHLSYRVSSENYGKSELKLNYNHLNYPSITTTETDTEVNFEMKFTDEKEIVYTKNNQTRNATLRTSYFVNHQSIPSMILRCELDTVLGVHYFYYDDVKNKIYQYDNQLQEELIFTSDLHNQILNIAKQLNQENELRVMAGYELIKTVYSEFGKDLIVNPMPIRPTHDYKEVQQPDQYLFDDFIPDMIYPLFDQYGFHVVEGLYVVEKNGLKGIINQDGKLVVNFEIKDMIVEDQTHLHSLTFDDCFSRRIDIENTEYRTCPGGHGGEMDCYYLINGADKVQHVFYGHDGPGSASELKENELSGKLSVYESVNKIINEEYIHEYWYEKSNKFGVFSDVGIITQPIYDDGLAVPSDLAAVSKNGLWGYVDQNGVEVIPCQYLPTIQLDKEYAYPALDGMIVAKNQEGKYGVLGYWNDELIPFVYDVMCPYSNRSILAKKDGQWEILKPFG